MSKIRLSADVCLKSRHLLIKLTVVVILFLGMWCIAPSTDLWAVENPFEGVAICCNLNKQQHTAQVSDEEGFVYYVLYFEQFHNRNENLFSQWSRNTQLIVDIRSAPSIRAHLVAARVFNLPEAQISSYIQNYERILGQTFSFQAYMSDSERANPLVVVRHSAKSYFHLSVRLHEEPLAEMDHLNEIAATTFGIRFQNTDRDTKLYFPEGVRRPDDLPADRIRPVVSAKLDRNVPANSFWRRCKRLLLGG